MKTPSAALAFLFPGQGSQTVGMGRALAEASPLARDLLASADRSLGYGISRICFEGPEEELQLTANAQPAILTISVACARILMEKGIHPAAVAGHSLGEYSALVAAGALGFDDAVLAVHRRGKYMQEAVPVGVGAMAALLGLDLSVATEVCESVSRVGSEVVSVANDNAPGQIVIAGHAGAVEKALVIAKVRGAKRAMRLPVSAPFHCELMAPARDRLAADLNAIAFGDPEIPVVTNVDARAVTTGAAARDALIRQVTGRVRWTESVRTLGAMGIRAVIEAGAGQILCGLARRIDPTLRATAAGDPAAIEAARIFAGEISEEGV